MYNEEPVPSWFSKGEIGEVFDAYAETLSWVTGDFEHSDEAQEALKEGTYPFYSEEEYGEAFSDVASFLGLVDEALGADHDNRVDCTLLEVLHQYWSLEQLGHDFYLTRNGHGAGFWDRYYGDADEGVGADIGRILTDLADSFGESNNEIEIDYYSES